jgi:hypothetical protein
MKILRSNRYSLLNINALIIVATKNGDGAAMNRGRIKPNTEMTDNFREAVRKTGKNNLQIALRLGLTVYQVNNIMSGNFDVEHRVVKEFCKEFDVDTSEIFVLP